MFSKSIFIALVVGYTFISFTQSEYSTFDSYVYMERDIANCTEPGLMCENCTDVSYCQPLPDGTYIKTHFETCATNTSCFQGACSTVANEECNAAKDDYVFICHQPGVFPNPFDCKTYYICTFVADTNLVVEKPLEAKCPTGYGFDPARGVCRTLLKDNKCPKALVEACTGPRLGPIPGNPNLFYMCLETVVESAKKFMPHIFVCEKNYEYFNNGCKNPHPVGVTDGKCKVLGKFYDETDCRKYKECTILEQSPANKTCPLNNKFNPLIADCQVFPCT